MSGVAVKVCGITEPRGLDAAISAGARYIGFVFFPPSPRHLNTDAARLLALAVPPGVVKVGLFVDAADSEVDQVLERVPLDMLQLHGHETPERLQELRARTGLPIMKALGLATKDDLAALDIWSRVADQILVDARPPADAPLPGGNGLAFDWRLLEGRRWSLPWMLAGGLTPDNVAEAIARTRARQVDVSSGVEATPGLKDAARIRTFLAAARAACPA